MIKKIIPNLIFIVLITLSLNVKAQEFSDVNKNAWYYDDVTYLEQTGIINGFKDNTFRPDDKVTYEQFIKMIIEALNIKISKNINNWSLPYIKKAKEIQILNFKIANYKNNISRGDMALLLFNTLEYLNEDIDITYNNLYDLPGCTKEKYIESILKLYNSGIITGFEDNTFRYEKLMTRAQACAVIHRLMTPNNRQKPTIISYSHVSACPFYIKDITKYYGIVNKFNTNIEINIDKVINTLAGKDGYLVVEYKKLSQFNCIIIKYYQEKAFSYKDEYSMFSLYLYDEKTNYPEKKWGYDTMFAKLQVKSLVPQYYTEKAISRQIDDFYKYKLLSLIHVVFGHDIGEDIGQYIISTLNNKSSNEIELRERNGFKTVFFTTSTGTIHNFTFSKME